MTKTNYKRKYLIWVLQLQTVSVHDHHSQEHAEGRKTGMEVEP